MKKYAKNTRFEMLSKEGSELSVQFRVFVDKQTGVNYLFVNSGYGCAVTPLIDRTGAPLTSSTGCVPEY